MCTSFSQNFGKKLSVTSCAPTILWLPIGKLDIGWFLVLTKSGNRYMHQVVHHHSSNFFWRSGKVEELRSYLLAQVQSLGASIIGSLWQVCELNSWHVSCNSINFLPNKDCIAISVSFFRWRDVFSLAYVTICVKRKATKNIRGTLPLSVVSTFLGLDGKVTFSN